jgi:hypothetical protein
MMDFAMSVLGAACLGNAIYAAVFGVEKGRGRVFGVVFAGVIYLVGRGAAALALGR